MSTSRVLVALAVVLALVLLAGAGLWAVDLFARRHPQDLTRLPQRRITVHGKPLTLLVADTPTTVGLGLSGQAGLADDHGLLLVSPGEDTRVTMLGMRFALDVVWLDAHDRVVDIKRRVPPRPLPLSYSAKGPAVAVVELPAGGVDRYGIGLGDVLGG